MKRTDLLETTDQIAKLRLAFRRVKVNKLCTGMEEKEIDEELEQHNDEEKRKKRRKTGEETFQMAFEQLKAFDCHLSNSRG